MKIPLLSPSLGNHLIGERVFCQWKQRELSKVMLNFLPFFSLIFFLPASQSSFLLSNIPTPFAKKDHRPPPPKTE